MSEEIPHRSTKNIPTSAQHRHFRIELHGHIDKRWMAAFDPISLSSIDRITRIEVLADQAGLRGILNRLWDLNLDIHSVVEVAEPAVQNGGK